MRTNFLPFSPPWIGEEEIAEVVASLSSDWITTGPKVKRFENEFADFLGAPASLALNSCTAALHVALLSLGIGPGDGVITTPMTFCSTIHVIEHVGARPFLVDVEPDTLNIDPVQVRELINQRIHDRCQLGRIKAILPVHLYGHPCDLDPLLEIAREYKLAVIEDAAHALPARYKGHMVGSPRSFPDVPQLGCFSFYATKNMTTAEGGMLTGTPELIEEARIWSLHGMTRDAWKRYSSEGSWYYEIIRAGFKYNMTDIQAALGLHQLKKLPGFLSRRQEIVHRYNDAFSQVPGLRIPAHRPEVEHAWHLYVLRLDAGCLNITRNKFIEELKARNIATSVHFIPVHMQPYYRDKYDYEAGEYPVAYEAYQRMVSLPLSPRMNDTDVNDVIEAVYDVIEKAKSCTIIEPKGPALVAQPRQRHRLPSSTLDRLSA